ncbi:Flagellar motor protein MotB, partial [Pseudomonas coronafaciens pv. oryzae]
EQLLAVAGYFKDPVGFSDSGSPYVIDLGGSPEMSPNQTLNPEVQTTPSPDTVPIEAETSETKAEAVEQERLEMLLQELQNKVEENPQLQKFKDQILFEITQDGLRIQIMDAENRPMFDSGSARLKPYFEDILLALADTIKSVPNKVSISGHTDATPFVSSGGFGNWELSANRANAARRALVAGTYPDAQVARVVGYASSALYDHENPTNPVNRRIDIVVLTKKAQHRIEGDQNSGGAPAKPAPAAPVTPAAPAAPGIPGIPGASTATPADPQAYAQPHEIRQKLNIFDDGKLRVEPAQN